ncbi:MAG: pre-peptidase C-terminal domain-containing protein [Planctomycetia bacterium]|nr:pre-peptidase C-terminal domain-containing protein [Planctomycetia bacterium]
MLNRFFANVVAGLFFVGSSAISQAADTKQIEKKPAVEATIPHAPDFARDIAPILKTYCNSCHNGKDLEGKLNLESFADLRKGGAGGLVVVPGQVEQSRLVLMLEGKAKPIMPPEGNEAPTVKEISVLKSWIAAGAKGPNGAVPDPTVLVTPKVKLSAPARNAIAAVSVSPTDPLAAVAGHGEVRIMSLDEQAVVRTLSGIRGPVTDLEFSRDGTLLAVAAGEPGLFGEAQLWNVREGKLVRTFTGHRDSLYAVALAADGRTLATASYDQTIKLWDVASGNAATGKETKTFVGHNGAVFDLSFNPAGTILASCGADRTVKLWDVKTGARLDTFSQSTKELYAVAFSPDGKTIVAGGADNRIRLWSISPTAKENTNPLTITRFAHEGSVLKLAYSADGKTLVSSGEDRIVRLWNPTTIMETRALEKQPDWVAGLALTADGKTLALGRMDGTFAVYDTATAKLRSPMLPQIVSLEPRGIERGKPTLITLRGTAMLGVTNVVLSGPDGKPVTATAKVVETSRMATSTTVEITPDGKLPRGEYRLVAMAGTSEAPAPKAGPVMLNIDDLAQASEVEPNNLAKSSATIVENTGAWGACTVPGDVDHFRFQAKKGQTLVCRIEAKSLGSMLNGFLALLDPAGETVAANNDFDSTQDPLIAYTVPQDGLYTVRVNDQAMTGSPQHFYRLSVGTFPLVTGVFPMNVAVGRESTLELVGFNLPAGAATTVKPTAVGELNVAIDAEKYRTSKPLKVAATMDAESVELEPNDAPAVTKIVATPAFVAGRIAPTKAGSVVDVDLVRFASKKGQSWIIETEAARRGSPLDTKIEVLAGDGKPVPRVLLQAVRDSYVTFRSVDSLANECRFFNWEEMELNQYAYLSGEVVKLFRKPRGPDSGFEFYQSAGRRRGYFDTSAAGHALDEAVYIVEPHPIGTSLVYNGLPTFTLNYANDDDALRKLVGDSRLTFTAPADGEYLVRVSDVRGFGGERFFYRLTIREPRPDFTVAILNLKPNVHLGSGTTVTFNAERVDDFEDDITIDVAGLPDGYTISQPVVVQAGHNQAKAVLTATSGAKLVADDVWKKLKWSARAQISGKDVVKPMDGFSSVTLEEKPKLTVKLEPAELTIAPGTTISAKLKIDRAGFTDRMGFDVLNLPHGVIVDNIGLNGILIPAGETERQIFLTCFDWVPETDRLVFAQTLTAKAGGAKVDFEASPAVMLKVRKPSTLVRADVAPSGQAPVAAPAK